MLHRTVQRPSYLPPDAKSEMGVMTIVLPLVDQGCGSEFFEIVRAWSYGSSPDGVAFICRRANIEADTGILHSNPDTPDDYHTAKITRRFELGDGLWLYRASDCLEI